MFNRLNSKLKNIKYLPTKPTLILDKKNRVYISTKHCNPDKNKIKNQPNKIDKFKKHLEEYFGKSKYFVITKAILMPNLFELIIGVGVWYYKDIDITKFNMELFSIT